MFNILEFLTPSATLKFRHVSAPLWKMLTHDRGEEMAERKRLAQRLSIYPFFADPHSPGQCGTH